MSRTAGVWSQDTPFPDGHIFMPLTAANFTSGTVTNTRAGKGLLSASIGASQTCVAMLPLRDLMFRYGMQDYAQEQWGSVSAGGAQGLATPPATFTTPYGASGNPPFTGATQLTPPSSRPKGILIKTITPVYSISGAALTLNTLGLSKTQFANNTAPVVTDILANAANGLATATQAQPYATAIALASNQQVMLTSRLAEYIIEWDITTQGGGAALVYGVFFDVSFNYN